VKQGKWFKAGDDYTINKQSTRKQQLFFNYAMFPLQLCTKTKLSLLRRVRSTRKIPFLIFIISLTYDLYSSVFIVIKYALK